MPRVRDQFRPDANPELVLRPQVGYRLWDSIESLVSQLRGRSPLTSSTANRTPALRGTVACSLNQGPNPLTLCRFQTGENPREARSHLSR